MIAKSYSRASFNTESLINWCWGPQKPFLLERVEWWSYINTNPVYVGRRRNLWVHVQVRIYQWTPLKVCWFRPTCVQRPCQSYLPVNEEVLSHLISPSFQPGSSNLQSPAAACRTSRCVPPCWWSWPSRSSATSPSATRTSTGSTWGRRPGGSTSSCTSHRSRPSPSSSTSPCSWICRYGAQRTRSC